MVGRYVVANLLLLISPESSRDFSQEMKRYSLLCHLAALLELVKLSFNVPFLLFPGPVLSTFYPPTGGLRNPSTLNTFPKAVLNRVKFDLVIDSCLSKGAGLKWRGSGEKLRSHCQIHVVYIILTFPFFVSSLKPITILPKTLSLAHKHSKFKHLR